MRANSTKTACRDGEEVDLQLDRGVRLVVEFDGLTDRRLLNQFDVFQLLRNAS